MTHTAAAVRNSLAVLTVGAGVTAWGLAFAGPVTFSVGGDDTTASIQNTVDAFRAALGDPNNLNAPGPLASGRREINWDGGGATTSSAPVTPFNVFRDSRGAQFTTPGSGLTQVVVTGDPVLSLDTLNATYATTFRTFSPNRLFAPIGSNITEGLFFIPGTGGATPAGVAGFGAVFTDVDTAGATTIEYLDVNGDLLFSAPVLAGSVADASLSFLGVVFDAGEQIARVRITTGTNALGPNDGGGVDVVVMDDFLYAEPQALVPIPATLALLGIGLAGLALGRRMRA